MHHFAEEKTLNQFINRTVLIVELHGAKAGREDDGMLVAEERE